MAGKGGGAWKVAYADFVTAMMAFFLVMWLVSQKEGVKEAVAGYFRDPFATYKSTEKGAAGAPNPVNDPMYGHTAQPQKRRLAISGDRTDYQFTVLFPSGSDELGPDQRQSIREFAPMMVGKLNRVEVRGHCVREPLAPDSSFTDHWQLCFARSQTVMQALIAEGIEAQRIRLSQAEGNEPLSRNLSDEELKLNSRVDVILLPDLADIPWERQKREAQAALDPPGAGQEPQAVQPSHDEPAAHEGAEASSELPQPAGEQPPASEPPAAAEPPPTSEPHSTGEPPAAVEDHAPEGAPVH
ncbi:MAG: OmpA family protein [Pirellulales bacterium]|nr:OmpA family protein [Pirellulales bacterium]